MFRSLLHAPCLIEVALMATTESPFVR